MTAMQRKKHILCCFPMIGDKKAERIEHVSQLAQDTSCIRKSILSYFGEDFIPKNCEMCSRCIPDMLTKEITSTEDHDYVSEQEREQYAALPFDSSKDIPTVTILKALCKDSAIPAKDLVSILTSTLRKNSSKRNFQRECYGILKSYNEKKEILEKMLALFLSQGYIKKNLDGTLCIRRKGLSLLKESVN